MTATTRTIPLPRPPVRGRGFTLIEVLATLVLIGIVLPVAMRGVTVALAAAAHAKRSVEAVSLAETRLTELVATAQWQVGNLSGDFGEDWPAYRWSAETFSRDVNLTELSVTVAWDSRGAERTVLVSTLLYTPSVE